MNWKMFKITIKNTSGRILLSCKTERHHPFSKGREVELDGKKYLISSSSCFTISSKGKTDEIFVTLTGNLNNKNLKLFRSPGCGDTVLVIDHDCHDTVFKGVYDRRV